MFKRLRNLASFPNLSHWLVFLAVSLASATMLGMIARPTLSSRMYVVDDLGAFSIPLRFFYAQGLQEGRFDLWCPEIFGGFYMHGEGQIGMLHPIHLFLYKFLPFTTAFGLELVGNYIALFFGCYLLFRRWSLSIPSAAFGAFVFTFSGLNLLGIVFINKIGVLAHAPLLMLALDQSIRDSGKFWPVWNTAFALLLASAIFVGYPFFFLMVLIMLLWYGLYLSNEALFSKRLYPILLATALGLMMGAAQLLPTWTTLRESTRSSPSIEFLAMGSLHPGNVTQWVNPYLLAKRKVGELAIYELGIYAGIGPLLLFIWICFRRKDPKQRLIWFLAALAALGFFLALGKYNWLYFSYVNLPVISLFRVPARFVIFTHFALAAGAAIGMDRLQSSYKLPASRGLKLTLLAFVLLSLCTVGVKVFSVLGARPEVYYFANFKYVVAGSFAVCAGVLLFFLSLRYGGVIISAFLVFSLCDMLFYSGTYLHRLAVSGLSYYRQSLPPVSPPGPVSRAEKDNSLIIGGYRLAGGYAGLEPRREVDAADAAYLHLLGVRAVEGEHNQWTKTFNGCEGSVRLVRPIYGDLRSVYAAGQDICRTATVRRKLDVTQDPTGSAVLLRSDPEQISFETNSAAQSLCLVTQRFHTGWVAHTPAGRLETVPVDGDFLGVVVPAGRQKVTLDFLPSDFRNGMRLTWTGLVLALGMLLISLFKVTPKS